MLLTLFVLGAAVIAAPSPPTSSDALQNALECRSVDDGLDAELVARSVPFDATLTTLASAVRIYGISTAEVSVFREGGTDLYTSYFPLEAAPLLARHAGLVAQSDGSYTGTTPLGDLALEVDAGKARLRCTVFFE